MDEFTDGQGLTDELNNDNATETDGQTGQDPSSAPLPSDAPENTDTVPVDQEASDIPEDLEDAEQGAEVTQVSEVSPTPVLDYEKLLEELQAQTKEIKAIHEIADQQADHNKSVENIGIVSIVGLALLCGFIGALIFSNYLKH